MDTTDRYSNLETPCFILDEMEFRTSIQGFREALGSHSPENVVGYSVKTNSFPRCLEIARDMGLYAEVVSVDEYQLALRCGFSRERIIYNGPMKDRNSFLDALTSGAIVNIETKREIDWLKGLPAGPQPYKVGIRLNINISGISPEDADGENDNSRFGFSDDTDEFANAIRQIDGIPAVKISGLHLHRTAHSRSIRFYRNLVKYAGTIIKKYSLDLDYLDLGGGYYGRFQDKPTYRNYADAFYEELETLGLGSLRLIIEPGNALVASAFSFLSSVIDVKHVEDGTWFITTDGSRNDIDPFYRKSRYLSDILSDLSSDIVRHQIIGGCTCLEYDRLFELTDHPLLKPGDRILYNNVGAYTMCLSPLFIRYFPRVYSVSENSIGICRAPWTASEYLQKSILNG